MYNPDEQENVQNLSEKIDAAIAKGIRQGQEAAKRRRIRARRRIGGTAAALALLLTCLLSIRVSPVFAAFVREIPGMEKFVDLINNSHDKGIQLAVDNDFVQPIGVSDEREGMKLTVQGIIADPSRMVLFYDVKLPSKEEYVEFNSMELTDGLGNRLPVSIGYSNQDEAKSEIAKTGIQRGTIDFNLMDDTEFPNEAVLTVKLKRVPLPDPKAPPTAELMPGLEPVIDTENYRGGTEFQVKFSIDRAKFAGLTREFPLGQTLIVEGQKITFDRVVISPLRVSVYMSYDAQNTKQIFGPGDIRIVDDKGIAWNHTLGSLAKDHPVLHFESPYFKVPKALYIEGSWFRALDKNKMTVTLDMDKREILAAPDNKLSISGIAAAESYIKLDFKLSGLKPDDHMLYNLFEQEFTDAKGIRYSTASLRGATMGTSSSSEPQEQHVYYYLENRPYAKPLTLTISNYPQYIREPYKIQIK